MEQHQHKRSGKYFLSMILLVFLCNYSFAQIDSVKTKGLEEVKEYYPNGKLKILMHKKGGLLHGETIMYNEKGDVIEKNLYKNSLLFSKKIYEKKLLVLNELYMDGKIIYSAKFGSDGVIGYEEIYNSNGGVIQIRYEKGKFKSSTELWSK